jgi:hypothetical protein
MENKAHVFQHNTTGVQIFVYHCIDEDSARWKFTELVYNVDNWVCLGQKTAKD